MSFRFIDTFLLFLNPEVKLYSFPLYNSTFDSVRSTTERKTRMHLSMTILQFIEVSADEIQVEWEYISRLNDSWSIKYQLVGGRTRKRERWTPTGMWEGEREGRSKRRNL